jgi:hypothetical protein
MPGKEHEIARHDKFASAASEQKKNYSARLSK